MDRRVRALADAQCGVLTRSQLTTAGVSRSSIRAQFHADRWVAISPTVIAVSTGELNREQRLWAAVLHAGGGAVLGGATAAAWAGLNGWDRDEICVLIPYAEDVPRPMRDVDFVRTRRDVRQLRARGHGIPRCKVAPAVLMFASGLRSPRAAEGVVAAAVQQRVTDAETLAYWLDRLSPLKRSPMLRRCLVDIAGGAQSVAEMDLRRVCKRNHLTPPRRQVKRRDASGRIRYTDCEWALLDGRILILEIDGSFHMAVDHWEDDLARQRALTSPNVVIVRCTSREVRDDGDRLADDLRRLGVPVTV